MDRSGALQPVDILWQPNTLLSVFIAGELLALLLAVNPASGQSPIVTFGLLSFGVQWVTMFTLGTLYASRGRFRRMRPRHAVYAGLALLMLVSLLSVALARSLLAPLWPDGGSSWPETAGRFAATLLTMAAFGTLALRAHWSAQDMALRAKQAELQALQARIRPHFLFNTLNTGAALIHERPEEAERLLLDLADLFRAALTGPRDIPLEEELALVRRYLEIESLRFGDRLRVSWQLPREVPRVMVPALSIQPLVENAIRHGIERVPRGGRVEIVLTTTGQHIVVRISNPLVLGERPGPTSHRVGIHASQARIEALTGGRGSVQTEIQGEHYVATVRLPRPRPANRRS